MYYVTIEKRAKLLYDLFFSIVRPSEKEIESVCERESVCEKEIERLLYICNYGKTHKAPP